jgi:xanthine dehydrogenase accessory factor
MRLAILEQLITAHERNRPVVLLTFLEHGDQALYYQDGASFGRLLPEVQRTEALQALTANECRLSADGGVFYQPYNPPLRLVIIGAVHISQHLAGIAAACGYQVTVVDPRQAFAAAARFPGINLVTDWPDAALTALAPDSRTAIVTLSHDPKLDDPALRIALDSAAFYIGALGSRKTQQSRRRRLSENGYTEERQARIHGPIGLDIGARSPAEIAVAIMAQITAALHADRH